MSLLFSKQIKEQIATQAATVCDSLHVITAYCKEDALLFIEKNLKNNPIKKRLIVRFRLDDILSGASDINIYDFCKSHGWELFVRFDLHAKTYIFDNSLCIVGSANLTSRGINLATSSNCEIATLCELTEEDSEKINTLFHNAIQMNDEIYAKMLQEIECAKSNKTFQNWSEQILSLFIPDFSVLFSFDFPNCSSPFDLHPDSLEFLNLSPNSTISEIKTAFKFCKSFLWLSDLLKQNNNELYFGSISEHLHNVLVNDPKPYRKEVKEIQQNLLNWIIELDIDNIIIDRPGFSHRIRYFK